jgi:3-methyladenine DNA glycosylase/8-oxoguanine DNA glycosylase
MWHVFPVDGALEIPLRGPKGEPVDFARTIVSHGVAELPPNKVDLPGRTLETTLPIPRGARTVRLTSRDGNLHVDTVAGTFHQRLAETIAHMFRLDEDLSGFYALVGEDDLAWCTTGAGRMLRAPTVFEDVVKTTCTPIRRISCRTNQTSPVLKWSRRQDAAFATGA